MKRKIDYKCTVCGEHKIRFDAHAEWDPEKQEMVLAQHFPDMPTICNGCGCIDTDKEYFTDDPGRP